jgi:hypothetical protein
MNHTNYQLVKQDSLLHIVSKAILIVNYNFRGVDTVSCNWSFFKVLLLLTIVFNLSACGGGSSGAKDSSANEEKDKSSGSEDKTFVVALSAVVVQQMSSGKTVEVNTEEVVSQTLKYSYE